MIVLAFLTDLAVVEKILRHLGLPHVAPALAPVRSAPWQAALDPITPLLFTNGIEASLVEEDAPADPPDEACEECADPSPRIRPPP